LSKETREKMGQITNSEYLVGKTGQTNVPLFTQAKFFDDVIWLMLKKLRIGLMILLISSIC
jgi:hypothetical protein